MNLPLRDLVALVALMISAGSIFFAAVQLRFLRKQMRAQHDWNRRVTSFTFAFTHDQNVREIRTRLYKHLNLGHRKPGEINLAEIQRRAENDYPEALIDLPAILDRLEAAAIAIKNGVADETICRQMLLGIVINYHRFFAQYIDDLRTSRNDPLIYEHLESLAKKWTHTPLELRDRTG